MKPECSVIKEKMFCVLSVICLLNVKSKEIVLNIV